MKRIKYLLFAFVVFAFVGTVYADPSFSIQPNKWSIQDGQSVTLTIKVSNTASWNIKVVSSGNTNGCNNNWADATEDGENTSKTFTTTCTATSSGFINFTVTGDITDSSGNNREINDNTKITVTEYVAPTKSSINSLNSLEVKGYELTPEFDPNVLEYSTTVPAGTESVYISITKKDSKSIANGDFKDVKVSEGANRCVITVTAEDGSKKKYVVIVNVESENPIVVKIDDKEYTVVQKAELLNKPNGYELSNLEIEEKSVPSFYNGKAKLTLVGLKDSDGNIGLYIYKDGNFIPYNVIEVNGYGFIVMSPEGSLDNYNKTKIININNKDYTVYYNEDDDIVLVYGMNVATGNVGWYKYDVEEQTFMRYIEEKNKTSDQKEGKDYFPIAMLFAGCLGFSIIILLILLAMNNNKEKKNKKLVEILESKMYNANEEEIISDEDEDLSDTSSRNLRFLELIDKEAEEKRNGIIEKTEKVPVIEEKTADEVKAEEPKELSKKELKKLAKQLKKEEEREAKEMREDFLSTRENVILSDTDILEEIPNSEEVLNPKKDKKNKKKKR